MIENKISYFMNFEGVLMMIWNHYDRKWNPIKIYVSWVKIFNVLRVLSRKIFFYLILFFNFFVKKIKKVSKKLKKFSDFFPIVTFFTFFEKCNVPIFNSEGFLRYNLNNIVLIFFKVLKDIQENPFVQTILYIFFIIFNQKKQKIA